MADLRYPIGGFDFPGALTAAARTTAIAEIAGTPDRLQNAVRGLTADQLDTPYRPEGWTVRQVVHHLPDSHLNSYCRFKLTLAEHRPVIRTYDEAQWARLPDVSDAIEPSLDLLDALHRRWVYLLERISDEQWSRQLEHPELGAMRLDELLALYAWHGRHHVAHITELRKREGW